MKNIFKIFLFIAQITFIVSEPEILDADIEEDKNLLVPQLIEKYNYNVETHYVTTEDGYILEMHRITGSPKSPPSKGKPPVLMMHGLIDSSATWVLMRPSYSLGYLLADEGFDVWLGNTRGNTYSRNHTYLDPDGDHEMRKKFWSFSWHEMGVYDLPAMIDHIVETTGKKKLQYVGHSQGSTAYMVMCSERPEYSDKIILANMMAPCAYLNPMPNFQFKSASFFLKPIEMATDLVGMYEYLPNSDLYSDVIEVLLDGILPNSKFIHENFIYLLMSSDQIDEKMLPVIFGHAPAGCSTRQLLHFGQLMQVKRFQKYDYGKSENLIRYKSSTPPEYNLKNVKAKMILYYVENDTMILGMNVERLIKRLPNVVASHLIKHKPFGHMDYLWGKDIRELAYDNIIKDMKNAEMKNSWVEK